MRSESRPGEGKPRPPSSRFRAWLLRALGPALLLVVLWRIENPGRLLVLAEEALGWEILLAGALNFAVVAFKVERWRRLLRVHAVEYAFRDAWNAFNAASYLGLSTPGRIGELLRVSYLTRQTGAETAQGLASVAVDRVWDLYLLLALASLGLFRFGSAFAAEVGTVAWLLPLGAGLLPLLLFAPAKLVERPLVALWRRVGGGSEPGNGFQRFLASVKLQARGALLPAGALSVASFALIHFQGWLLARALHLPLELVDVIGLGSLAALFGLLPISVSGIGVRELLFAVAFPVLGFGAERGVAYGLSMFLVQYVPMAIYGLWVWVLHPLPASAASASSAGGV